MTERSEGSFIYGVLSRSAGRPVQPGDRARFALTRAVLSGARAPATLVKIREQGHPWSPSDVILTMDFQAPEIEAEIHRSRAFCRETAEVFGLNHVFDLNTGVGSHVVLERALLLPGALVVGSGRCLGVTGALGVLGVRLDDDPLTRAVLDGGVEISAPLLVEVGLTGRPSRSVGAWDLVSRIGEELGDGLQGRAVEFSGDTREWSLDLRVGITGLLMEMGALTAVFPPDEVTERFLRERGVEDADSEIPRGGVQAEKILTLDVSDVSPVEADDYNGARQKLDASGGSTVDGVFIGSCYGGRYEDLALVAEGLKKAGQVHPDVRLVVSPATLETAQAALASGFYETFLEAGAMVVVPGGGPGSAGGGAIFGEGERIASTAEYHRHLHPGQGVPHVHIVSPAAAAVAATTGSLIDPGTALD